MTTTKTATTRPTRICRLGFGLALALLAVVPAAAGEKRLAYAVVAGTVFQEPGFALPGARVVLTAKSLPPGVKRFKPLEIRSDVRGEYAFHVPPGKTDYVVAVSRDGFVGQEKPAHVETDERVDVYFELKAVK